jgi:hypothetical protein
MAKKIEGTAAVKKWTYNGIKTCCPFLSFTEWLSICKRKDRYLKNGFLTIAAVLKHR